MHALSTLTGCPPKSCFSLAILSTSPAGAQHVIAALLHIVRTRSQRHAGCSPAEVIFVRALKELFMTRSTLLSQCSFLGNVLLQLNSARAQLRRLHIFSTTSIGPTGLGSNWQVAYGGFTTDADVRRFQHTADNGNWASGADVGTPTTPVSGEPDHSRGIAVLGSRRRSTDSLFDSSLYTAQLSTAGSVNLTVATPGRGHFSERPQEFVAGTSYNLKLVVTGIAVHPRGVREWGPCEHRNRCLPKPADRGACGIQNYNAS